MAVDATIPAARAGRQDRSIVTIHPVNSASSRLLLATVATAVIAARVIINFINMLWGTP